MIPLTARQIADAIAGSIVSGSGDAVADAVSIDSRKSLAGSCFFAIVGERRDGHDFIADAVAATSSVVVVDRPVERAGNATIVQVDDTTAALQALATWLRRHLDPVVVAVTGSLGKTTTKELTARLLASRYDVHATPGNLNNHWGLPLSLLGLEPHHEVMVAELAMSHAGEIRALADLAAPGVGIITNVAPAHMENFDDLEAVAAAKGELAAALPENGTLIVNADDPLTNRMPQTAGAHVSRALRFGRHRGADVRAAEVAASASGWTFTLHAGAEHCDITLNLPGVGGISGFLAAATAAWALEVPLDAISAQAPTLEPLANRGSVRFLGSLTLLDESYNASPVAVKAALDTLAGLPTTGRRIAVLGDMLEMGEWTDRVHRQVGQRVAEIGTDLLVSVGAFADLIAEGAVAAGMSDTDVHEFATAEDAAAWLPERLRAGDVLLVKGSRGVHLEHVVNAVTAAPVGSNGSGDR